jgi:hypothetical protein
MVPITALDERRAALLVSVVTADRVGVDAQRERRIGVLWAGEFEGRTWEQAEGWAVDGIA